MSIISKQFQNENNFKIWLGKELKKLGFEIYIDENISDLPTFHGDSKKPDILVFFKENRKKSNQIDIESPLAIETKYIHKENRFSDISHSIMQIRRYYNKKYYTSSWKGKVKNTILSTSHSIATGHVFEYMHGDNTFHDGVDWTIKRILWSISNNSGILKKTGKYFYINFYNSSFFLANGGYLDSKWGVIR